MGRWGQARWVGLISDGFGLQHSRNLFSRSRGSREPTFLAGCRTPRAQRVVKCKERILSPPTSEDTKWAQAERRKRAISVEFWSVWGFLNCNKSRQDSTFGLFFPLVLSSGKVLFLFKEHPAELQCPEFVPNRVAMSWGRVSVRDSGDMVGKDTTLANTMRSH